MLHIHVHLIMPFCYVYSHIIYTIFSYYLYSHIIYILILYIFYMFVFFNVQGGRPVEVVAAIEVDSSLSSYWYGRRIAYASSLKKRSHYSVGS